MGKIFLNEKSHQQGRGTHVSHRLQQEDSVSPDASIFSQAIGLHRTIIPGCS